MRGRGIRVPYRLAIRTTSSKVLLTSLSAIILAGGLCKPLSGGDMPLVASPELVWCVASADPCHDMRDIARSAADRVEIIGRKDALNRRAGNRRADKDLLAPVRWRVLSRRRRWP